MSFPVDAAPALLEDCRRSFFSGAMVAVNMMTEIAVDAKKHGSTTQQHADRMNALRKECVEFAIKTYIEETITDLMRANERDAT
jgi:hypothetical protein